MRRYMSYATGDKFRATDRDKTTHAAKMGNGCAPSGRNPHPPRHIRVPAMYRFA